MPLMMILAVTSVVCATLYSPDDETREGKYLEPLVGRNLMATYCDWFSVDVKKRAATVRSRSLGVVLKELVSNSLDAGATCIDLACKIADGTRRDKSGMRAFEVTCVDDGNGCSDPEILRRIGSSTSDLHAETRGRFGQGLIDVLAISESSEIRTLRHRLVFDRDGCQIGTIRNDAAGMQIEATC